MSPLEYEQLTKAVLVLVLVIIPALTVTGAVAARFAVRPIVDAIARLRELSAPAAALPPAAEARLGAVELEMREMRDAIERIAAAVEFDARLRAGSDVAPRLPQA